MPDPSFVIGVSNGTPLATCVGYATSMFGLPHPKCQKAVFSSADAGEATLVNSR